MKNFSTIYVMGVSGCGKSTIGMKLSNCFNYDFFDADDLHPKSNVEKMANNIPLNDLDRKPWLEALNSLATGRHKERKGSVIACSCLKPQYRKQLQANIEPNTIFVYLEGSFNVISERMSKRGAHYFNGNTMLLSQFETLVAPSESEGINYIKINIDNISIEECVEKIEHMILEVCDVA